MLRDRLEITNRANIILPALSYISGLLLALCFEQLPSGHAAALPMNLFCKEIVKSKIIRFFVSPMFFLSQSVVEIKVKYQMKGLECNI